MNSYWRMICVYIINSNLQWIKKEKKRREKDRLSGGKTPMILLWRVARDLNYSLLVRLYVVMTMLNLEESPEKGWNGME